MVCGLPNAGKTTYSKRFQNVVHYDDYAHLPKAERDSIFRAASCVEGIFNSRRGRMSVLDGRSGTCIWIDTPAEVCASRGNDTTVWCHAAMFEPPTYDEGWSDIWIVRNDERHHLERET